MLCLGVETSCDETAIAPGGWQNDPSNLILSQIENTRSLACGPRWRPLPFGGDLRLTAGRCRGGVAPKRLAWWPRLTVGIDRRSFGWLINGQGVESSLASSVCRG